MKACEPPAGINFTYTKATASALQATSLQFDSVRHVSASQVVEFATATLDAHGFTARPVGPAHIRVLLVSAKRG